MINYPPTSTIRSSEHRSEEKEKFFLLKTKRERLAVGVLISYAAFFIHLARFSPLAGFPWQKASERKQEEHTKVAFYVFLLKFLI